jgi:hypothetical protein
VSKVTLLKTGKKYKKSMIHLDKLDNGTWRLIYSEDVIPELDKIDSFEIVRED